MATFVKHQACQKCKSSDGSALYNDGTSYCFVCKTFFNSQGDEMETDQEPPEKPLNDTEAKGSFRSLTDRKINKETCEKYGVTTIKTKDGGIVRHFYPYHDPVTGEVKAFKVRDVKNKKFIWKGQAKAAGLFGQGLFPSGSAKFVTVTEGELDCLAAYQMLGSKWPVVSIKNGTSGADRDLKVNERLYHYLNGFDTIVISFDNDEPGREAAKKLARMFTPGKARIVKLDNRFSDPCDYLRTDSGEDYKAAWWAAEQFRPDGLLVGQDLVDRTMAKKEAECYLLPWRKVNELTYGVRTSEVWTFIAGTGLGKSLLLREMGHHLMKTTDFNVGAIFLEETIERTSLGFATIEADIPFHLPDANYTEDEKLDALQKTVGSGRIVMYDSWGENDIDRILEVISYMAKVHDCRWIILDHISMLDSEGEYKGNERQMLDSIITKLRKLAQSLDIGLFIVSHVRKTTQSVAHEEGGAASLADIRGTGGIAQLSDMVVSLQRNGQADNELERNTTLIRILKNRFSGLTGPASQLRYNNDTGRLLEAEPDDERDLDEFDTEPDEELESSESA